MLRSGCPPTGALTARARPRRLRFLPRPLLAVSRTLPTRARRCDAPRRLDQRRPTPAQVGERHASSAPAARCSRAARVREEAAVLGEERSRSSRKGVTSRPRTPSASAARRAADSSLVDVLRQLGSLRQPGWRDDAAPARSRCRRTARARSLTESKRASSRGRSRAGRRPAARRSRSRAPAPPASRAPPASSTGPARPWRRRRPRRPVPRERREIGGDVEAQGGARCTPRSAVAKTRMPAVSGEQSGGHRRRARGRGERRGQVRRVQLADAGLRASRSSSAGERPTISPRRAPRSSPARPAERTICSSSARGEPSGGAGHA